MQHNLAMVGEASRQAEELLERAFPGRLSRMIAVQQAEVDAEGKQVVAWGNMPPTALADMDDDHLRMADLAYAVSLPGGEEAVAFARHREKLAMLKNVRRALQQGEALEGPETSPVELCKEDARGAWTYWLVSATTAPESNELDRWNTARDVRLARVENDGTVVIAPELASYLRAPGIEEHFPQSPTGNCCELDYGQGAPRVLFHQDQDGDGVAELALKASVAVEGSYAVSTIVYRFKDGRIETRQFNDVEAEDVDGDGRVDLLSTQWVSAADQCGSGFESHSTSPRLLGHSQPDGSFSFDDAAARAHLQKACPAPPKQVRTPDDVWCALTWGRSREAVLREARKRCRVDPCAGDENVVACQTMELAVKGFEPPLRLDAAKSPTITEAH